MPDQRLFIGTSGWSYPHWGKGVFYPDGLRQGEWLAHYASLFDTVEVNTTFYRMPRPSMIERWMRTTGEGYRFSAKLWRRVTHYKRLQLTRIEVEDFCASLSPLGSKLGPLLVQLPPDQGRDLPRLEAFLHELATARGDVFSGVVLEVRNPEWVDPQLYRILDRHGVALCLSDLPRCPVNEPNDVGMIYIRRHGPPGDPRGRYREQDLVAEAARIRSWLDAGREVSVYFNNDLEGFAPENARELKALLGQVSGEPPLPL